MLGEPIAHRAPRRLPVLADPELHAGHPRHLGHRRPVRACSPASSAAAASTSSPRRRRRPRAASRSQKLGGYLVALSSRPSLFVGRHVSPRRGVRDPARATRSGSTPSLAHAAWLYVMVALPRRGRLRGRAVPRPRRRRSASAASRSSGASSSAATPERLGPSSRSSRCPTSRSRPATGRSPGVCDWPAVGRPRRRRRRRCSASASRRSRGATSSSRPAAASAPDAADLWLAGPFTRALGERLPAAIAWGAVLGALRAGHRVLGDQFVATLSVDPADRRDDQADLPGRGHPLGRRVPAAGLLLRGDPDREPRRRRRSSAAGRPTRASAGSSSSSAPPVDAAGLGAPERPGRAWSRSPS